MPALNDNDPTLKYAWPLIGACAVLFFCLLKYAERHSPPPMSNEIMQQMCLAKWQASFPALADTDIYQMDATLSKDFLGSRSVRLKVTHRANQQVIGTATCSLTGRFKDAPTLTNVHAEHLIP